MIEQLTHTNSLNPPKKKRGVQTSNYKKIKLKFLSISNLNFSKWISKECAWSFFLSVYLFFPLLNSFEVIFFTQQKWSFSVVAFSWVFLYVSFQVSQNFYNLTLELMFSRPLEIYMEILAKCFLFLKKFPKTVGFFYGCCFLSFYLKTEFPQILFFSLIGSAFFFIRNVFLIPFFGVTTLGQWVLSRVNYDIESKRTDSKILFFLKGEDFSPETFQEFNALYFRHIPLVNPKHVYSNYKSRRTMISIIRSVIGGMPGKEQLHVVATSTFGTTALGGVAVATFSTGMQSDAHVRELHEKSITTCDKVLSHPDATQTQCNIATQIKVQAETARDLYFTTGGSHTSIRGASILTGDGTTSQMKQASLEASLKATELNGIVNLHGPIAEKKMQQFTEKYNFEDLQVPKIPSVLETFFWF